MNNTELTHEFIFKLEKVEALALEDFYRSAHPEIAKRCGIKIITDGSLVTSIVSRSDVLSFNRNLGLGLKKSVKREDIVHIITAYRDAGVKRFFVQLNPVITDSDIPDLLRQSGFEHYNNWVKLYRDVRLIIDVRSDLRVEKIDYRQADNFSRIVATCFDWDDDIQPWVASTVGRDGWHHYMGYDGNTPVAVGAFFVHKDSAWVDFAATLKDYQGRGAQAILLQRRVDDIASLGCHHIIVETAQQTSQKSAPSYRNMLRYGFTEAYVRPNYIYRF